MSRQVDIVEPEVEYEEDLYLQELHKRLTILKNDRKKIEKL